MRDMTFVAIISCGCGFASLERLSGLPENIKRVLLFADNAPNLYEMPPSAAQLLTAKNCKCFGKVGTPRTLAKIDAHLRGLNADIWFFMRSDDAIHALYPTYLESFFNNTKCNVVFTPVLSDGNRADLIQNDPRLPAEFLDLPRHGIFDYSEFDFPESIDGAAIWAKNSAPLDTSKGENTWADLLRRTANINGKFGRLNSIFLSRGNKNTAQFSAASELAFRRQRQRDGIAAAKLRGTHCGRPLKSVTNDFETLVKAWERKEIPISQVCEECGNISVATFYRRRAEYKKQRIKGDSA